MLKYFWVLFFLWSNLISAQTYLDHSFADNGKLEYAFHDYHEVVQMKKISDGSILVLARAGRVNEKGYDNELMLTKINEAGEVDLTFGVNGHYVGDFYGFESSLAVDFLELNGGNILILGHAFVFETSTQRPVVLQLLNASGQVITGFGNNGILQFTFLGESNTAYGLHLDDDGNILIAASSADPVDNSGTVAVIARLTPSMELDLSFGGTGKIEVDPTTGPVSINAKVTHASSTLFSDVITTTDGAIFAVGSTYSIYRQAYIVKLKANGELDSSFYQNGIYTWTPSSNYHNNAIKIEELSDGTLLIPLKTEDVNNNFTMLRVKDDLVTAHIYDVAGQQDFLEQVVEDENGDVYMIGRSVENDLYNSASYANHYSVIKLTPLLTKDPTFGFDGMLTFQWDGINQAGANEAILSSSGQLILAGEVYEANITGTNVGVVKIAENIMLATENYSLEEEINAFPNPVNDYLTITTNDHRFDELTLVNSLGEIVINELYANQKIAMYSLPNGIYFLRGRIGEQRISKKIIKVE